MNCHLFQIAKSANGALRNLMVSSPPSRSTSPASSSRDYASSSRDYQGKEQLVPAPTDLWLDDFSLISSNDSRSRTSTSSPPVLVVSQYPSLPCCISPRGKSVPLPSLLHFTFLLKRDNLIIPLNMCGIQN